MKKCPKCSNHWISGPHYRQAEYGGKYLAYICQCGYVLGTMTSPKTGAEWLGMGLQPRVSRPQITGGSDRRGISLSFGRAACHLRQRRAHRRPSAPGGWRP
jgi:hypothetical protein